MRIIEIQPLGNGAHRNQTISGTTGIPEGWAVLPGTVDTQLFPFGDVTVEEVSGVPTVTVWVPNTAAWEEWQAGQVSLLSDEEPVKTTQEILADHEDRIAALEKLLTGTGVAE